MVFPIYKAILVLTKSFSKPVNNWLKIILINRFKTGSNFFKWVGNKTHELEIKINRRILSKGKTKEFYIKPLADEAAIS
jgi:hypothetical protein